MTIYTYSTLLGYPSITTPSVTNLLPFSCTITATGSITPSKTLTYRFSSDGGSTWTSYQSSNSYNWIGLSEETSYNMAVMVLAAHVGDNASDTSTMSSILEVITPADQASIRLKILSLWKKGKLYIKKLGIWRKAKKVYIKKNGVWYINKND